MVGVKARIEMGVPVSNVVHTTDKQTAFVYVYVGPSVRPASRVVIDRIPTRGARASGCVQSDDAREFPLS